MRIQTINTSRIYSIFIYWIVAFCLFFSGLIALIPGANAQTSDLSRSYSSDESLEAGNIVSVLPDKGNFVESAQPNNANSLLGVVVGEKDSLLSIDENMGDVSVAIAGRAEALVDTTNGRINRGDLVGLGSTSGVGAKALDGNPVVGIAEASFGSDDTGSVISGLIPIIVSVGSAPNPLSGVAAAQDATWLRSLAGQQVSALQIAFLFFIAVVGLSSIVVLIYSSIRNGVVAIGRNPLARPSIFGALTQVMIMVSIIAIVSFSLMYFVLRL